MFTYTLATKNGTMHVFMKWNANFRMVGLVHGFGANEEEALKNATKV